MKDKLEVSKNSRNATDEDQLAYKYMNTVSTAMSDLYSQTREIQGSNLPNSEKYAKVRELKEQINKLAQEGLASYDSIDISGGYATAGGVVYQRNKNGEWTKMREETLKKMSESGLSDEQKGQFYDNYYNVQNARDVVKENTPLGQTADYREATISSIRNADMDSKTKNVMFDSYYPSKFTDAVNGMDLDDDLKLEMKFAKTLANGTKDENGKTVSNSKAQAVADAYKSLGVLDDVLKYIAENDIAPSVMGLSKTVYNKLIKGGSTGSSGGKSSSGKSSKRSKSSYSGRTSSGKGKVSAGNPRRNNMIGKLESTKIANNFLKAYANTLNRASKQSVSSGGGAGATCPNCGSRVSPNASRCPVCGANL